MSGPRDSPLDGRWHRKASGASLRPTAKPDLTPPQQMPPEEGGQSKSTKEKQ